MIKGLRDSLEQAIKEGEKVARTVELELRLESGTLSMEEHQEKGRRT